MTILDDLVLAITQMRRAPRHQDELKGIVDLHYNKALADVVKVITVIQTERREVRRKGQMNRRDRR